MRVRAAFAVLLAGAALACGKSQSPPDPAPPPPPPQGDRTVTGTFRKVHWLDDGTRVTVPAPPSAAGSPRPSAPAVSALVPTASGYEVKPGTVDAAGNLSIPGVPQGRYFLAVEGSALDLSEHAGDQLDLASHLLGRPDVVVPAVATPVTVSLTGLAPWTPFIDVLSVTSSNAGLWTALWGDYYTGADLSQGVTSVSATVDFQSTVVGATPLPEAAKGDVVYLTQLSTMPGGTGEARVLTRAARLTGVTLAEDSGGTIAATLQPAPMTGRFSVDVKQSAFEALLPQLGPGARASAFDIWVDAAPHPLSYPGPIGWGPDLVIVRRYGGAPDFTLSGIAYGQPLDALWHEWRLEYFTFQVDILVGTVRSRGVLGVVVQTAALTPALWPVVTPRLTPARSPTIDGRGAFQQQAGVGTTPVLAWGAPDRAGASPLLRRDCRPGRLRGLAPDHFA